MAKEYINDEQLKLVSGGKLIEGWEKALMDIIRLYKGKYVNDQETGINKVKELMTISANDPTSQIDEGDLQTLYDFIDANWESAVPWKI